MLLAFAIFGMLATGVTLALTAVLRSTHRTALQAKVRNEGEYLMETMSQLVRYSNNTVCSGDTSAMKYTPTDTTLPRTMIYCKDAAPVSGYNLTTGVAQDQINSAEVILPVCYFHCLPDSGSENANCSNMDQCKPASSVEIVFSIQDKNGIVSPVYYDTNIVLRNFK